MKFKQILAKNVAYGLLFIGALVVLDATEVSVREELPPGWNECWNPDTTGITIVEGKCPKRK